MSKQWMACRTACVEQAVPGAVAAWRAPRDRASEERFAVEPSPRLPRQPRPRAAVDCTQPHTQRHTRACSCTVLRVRLCGFTRNTLVWCPWRAVESEAAQNGPSRRGHMESPQRPLLRRTAFGGVMESVLHLRRPRRVETLACLPATRAQIGASEPAEFVGLFDPRLSKGMFGLSYLGF
jgi:hypothetical protein